MEKEELEKTKIWASEKFGIPKKDVLWYNHGICYDRIGVRTKKSADKVSVACTGERVNGGMYDGMPLGAISHIVHDKEEYWDVTC